ncbi:MAG: hypothetical protein HY670_12165 [Chloroflexi bacterium]|nr:hypothetical protein [Chloroflexota bacterium]
MRAINPIAGHKAIRKPFFYLAPLLLIGILVAASCVTVNVPSAQTPAPTATATVSAPPATVTVTPTPVPRSLALQYLEAANNEADAMQTVAQAYYGAYGKFPANSAFSGSSDFITGTPKARYYFDASNGRINKVTSEGVASAWSGIVYDLSDRKWVEGTPDGAAPDLDKP